MAHGSKGDVLDNLAAQRIIAGLTPDGLAKRAGMNEYRLRQVELGGNCEVYESQRLADALGISLATLGQHKA
jgi:hypothetical protein